MSDCIVFSFIIIIYSRQNTAIYSIDEARPRTLNAGLISDVSVKGVDNHLLKLWHC